jgi:hypothetical protein
MGKTIVGPAGKVYDGKGEKERLAEAEAILREFLLGTPVSSLGETFGLSRATIYRRVDEALAARIVPTVDEYRAQQNALLDDLTAKWRQQVDAAEVMLAAATEPGSESVVGIERAMKMRTEALNGLLRVVERRARLNGTDAPVRVEATVTDATPSIDAKVAELAEAIKAKAS